MIDINEIQQEIESFFNENNAFIIFSVIIIILLSYILLKKYLSRIITNYIEKSKTKIDDILLKNHVLTYLAYIAPALVLYIVVFYSDYPDVYERFAAVLIIITVLLSVNALLTSIPEIFHTLKIAKDLPLENYTRVVKTFLYVIGFIIIVGILTNQSPGLLLTGMGAVMAILLLIFRDTILSLVASIQISTKDLIRKGDWIEVPKYGADGAVIDISLHTVKVQNWDKTITAIPTYKLMEETFKNWRGMAQSGGRRIKRAIHIDISSIKLCDQRMIEKFRKYQLLTDYLDSKQVEIDEYNRSRGIDASQLINGRSLTNIGTFRIYVKAFLQYNPKIHNKMTFLVRQLAPGPEGLPLEIYVFTTDTVWAHYEAIQADIFDHLLAVVPLFELRVYQHPSGADFQKLADPALRAELEGAAKAG